ncbi:MAG: glycosyltransferase family 2 protein [Bacteroidia bacterium]|nr:glycosyltransferase family 2 protein [Bacteroidia bacterium]NNC85155.1 glycosyltransferase family 2 protein [Bacteroidia bacterium]NNM15775.1 glycosyltransferase family 2 protein [Bacteroidia bacterium]
MKRLIQKAISELTLSKTPVDMKDVTPRRVVSFLFKKKAYERGSRMLHKTARYVVRKTLGINLFDSSGYKEWKRFNSPTASDLKEYKKLIPNFKYQPLISIVLPVYNSNLKFLEQCCDSVFNQIYENWELCISDDYSTIPGVIEYLKQIKASNSKVKLNFRSENGHISANTNDAIELASGEFVAFLDHDDLLAPEALYEIVKELNADQTHDLIYSDEDFVDARGNTGNPYFKPDWSPESFLARNYITHLSVFRKSILNELSGMRTGFEGSQDYDLLLRFTERTQNIKHIPKVLYHWRIHNDSSTDSDAAKPYAYEAGVKALTEALQRRGINGTVALQEGMPGYYEVHPELKENYKVSIIIPSKNEAEVLKKCIDSIIEKSTYKNYEIIVIDNDSTEESFHKLTDQYKSNLNDRFQAIRLSIEFNFSTLMNVGVKRSSGDFVLLLNNDMEVITPNWIQNMLEFAQLKDIGAVGAKLLYPNGTIQHSGTVIGLGGIAGHTFIGKEANDDGYFYAIKSINNYSAVTAACLMIKKEKFEQVNGFEEKLPVEFNDVDFCLRVLEAGYRNVYLPNVELYHYESLSRGNPHASEESHKKHLHAVKYFKEHWKKYIEHDPSYSPNLTLMSTHFDIRV